MASIRSKLRDLWRYDLPRQSLIAFVVPALITALIVGTGAALDWGSEESFYAVDPSREVVEASLRHETRQYAEAEGGSQGTRDADAELIPLSQNGSYEQGRALAYDFSWNLAVRAALDKVSSQWLEDEPGTQWVELFR